MNGNTFFCISFFFWGAIQSLSFSLSLSTFYYYYCHFCRWRKRERERELPVNCWRMDFKKGEKTPNNTQAARLTVVTEENKNFRSIFYFSFSFHGCKFIHSIRTFKRPDERKRQGSQPIAGGLKKRRRNGQMSEEGFLFFPFKQVQGVKVKPFKEWDMEQSNGRVVSLSLLFSFASQTMKIG